MWDHGGHAGPCGVMLWYVVICGGHVVTFEAMWGHAELCWIMWGHVVTCGAIWGNAGYAWSCGVMWRHVESYYEHLMTHKYFHRQIYIDCMWFFCFYGQGANSGATLHHMVSFPYSSGATWRASCPPHGITDTFELIIMAPQHLTMVNAQRPRLFSGSADVPLIDINITRFKNEL